MPSELWETTTTISQLWTKISFTAITVILQFIFNLSTRILRSFSAAAPQPVRALPLLLLEILPSWTSCSSCWPNLSAWLGLFEWWPLLLVDLYYTVIHIADINGVLSTLSSRSFLKTLNSIKLLRNFIHYFLVVPQGLNWIRRILKSKGTWTSIDYKIGMSEAD